MAGLFDPQPMQPSIFDTAQPAQPQGLFDGMRSTYNAHGLMGFVPPELRGLPAAALWFMKNMAPGSSDVSSLMDYSRDATNAGRDAMAGNWSGAGSNAISALTNVLAAAPLVPSVAGMVPKTASKLYHVAEDYSGGPLKSLYAQYGDEAYDIYAKRWPDAGELGQYHPHYVHLWDDLAKAEKYRRDFVPNGKILEVDARGLDVETDMLEGLRHPIVRNEIPVSAVSVAGMVPKTAMEATDQLKAAMGAVSDHEKTLIETMKALGFSPSRVSQSGKSEAKYLTFVPDAAGLGSASKKGKSLFVQEFPGGHPWGLDPLTVRIAGHANHGAGTSTPSIQWSINSSPEENAAFVRRYIERARELAAQYPAGGGVPQVPGYLRQKPK